MTEWHDPGNTDKITNEMAGVYQSGYTKADRYRDFVNTFRKSEYGLRVLHQILQWGNIYGSSIPSKTLGVPVDPNEILINEGERRLALKILSTVNVEPAGGNPPQRTVNKENTNV